MLLCIAPDSLAVVAMFPGKWHARHGTPLCTVLSLSRATRDYIPSEKKTRQKAGGSVHATCTIQCVRAPSAHGQSRHIRQKCFETHLAAGSIVRACRCWRSLRKHGMTKGPSPNPTRSAPLTGAARCMKNLSTLPRKSKPEAGPPSLIWLDS